MSQSQVCEHDGLGGAQRLHRRLDRRRRIAARSRWHTAVAHPTDGIGEYFIMRRVIVYLVGSNRGTEPRFSIEFLFFSLSISQGNRLS
jgi:hypothetical protein